MSRYFVLAAFVGVSVYGGEAQAQRPSTDQTDPCATAPMDLLVALEGTWSLSQGAGTVVSPVGPMPLPARGGQALILEYDEGLGALVGSDQDGGSMVMTAITGDGVVFPEEGIQIAERIFGNELLEEQSAANCDFYSLPLIVGSNAYDLVGGTNFGVRLDRVSTVGAAVYYSLTCPAWADPDTRQADWPEGYEPTETERVNREADYREMCQEIEPHEGQLIRSLLLRFSSMNSGSGMLYFAGNMDGFEAWAAIPVTVSR